MPLGSHGAFLGEGRPCVRARECVLDNDSKMVRAEGGGGHM